MTALSVSCLKGCYELVQLLISLNNCFEKTSGGENLLHLSSQSGNIDLVKFIISFNISLQDKTSNGLNAIHFACKGKDCGDIVNMLIEQKCDYLEKTKNVLFQNCL